MRQKIVAANWKMNLLPNEAAALAKDVAEQSIKILKPNCNVVLGMPATHFHAVRDVVPNSLHPQIFLGAQNCHPAASGAYTGELSLSQIAYFGVNHIIIGHSERRTYFAESNEFIKQKVDAILANNLTPIFCCGEPLNIREAGTEVAFVSKQFDESIMHLDAEAIQKVVIAYEPIWAIGTGVTASSAQAQEMHAALRHHLAHKYGVEVANNISILYGGSCNASNAAELFAQADIDGGLIGGAALKVDTFMPIVEAMCNS
jgi:triosephosphate isomerase (TIM)